MNEKKKICKVDYESTLLKFLQSCLKDLSTKKIKSYIKYKMVEVNGKVITNSSKIVKKDDEVIIYFTKRNIPKYDLKILYEDKDLIAIDKPSGLLSISNSKEKEITAFRMVSDYVKSQNPKAKIFVIHRLDQFTSGILVFSKNLALKEKLQKNWNDLVSLREYVCVVSGKMNATGKFESYLTMNHFQIVHSTKNKELGKYALTKYKLLKFNGKYSLLKVNIETGRRNQIRVHLSENGHPIVGDKKYGSKEDPINRLALHASTLKILDPRTNQVLTIKSEVPQDILKLVK